MRIWDINPGYLNRQSLLGEHRELHGIVSIIENNKKGYSRHPETVRWVGFGWALKQRHKLLAAEMKLRGYNDKTPVGLISNKNSWPENYINTPFEQINILSDKYTGIESGRIPLPKNAQQIWSQHKYSVMARDLAAYKSIGKFVATDKGKSQLESIANDLTKFLRQPPDKRLILNTLHHLWGYVSEYASFPAKNIEAMNAITLLATIQKLAMANEVTYVVHSTALGELSAWDI
ncbi:MAG: DUF1722 domain-containing protein [Calditrichaeota bacterium]|nr:MAG: DUF1722 domain-containing protein [Calditrichota bacterium]